MAIQIITCFLLQAVFTVGVIFLFGFLIAFCNKRFYANFGNFGRSVCYITGAVGTPVHECAHALFCLLFGHKITEIKLFQINSSDGTLGYVNHSYNKKNIYHIIGNFFIGVAPITVISALLYFAAYLLIPELVLQTNIGTSDVVSDFGNTVLRALSSVAVFFSYARKWQWWVYLLIGIPLSLHMTLSKADIKSSLFGLVVLLAVVLIVDIVLGVLGNATLDAFTRGVLNVGSMLLCILTIAFAVSLIALIMSFVFRFAKSRLLLRGVRK